jgi:hypothetical protein
MPPDLIRGGTGSREDASKTKDSNVGSDSIRTDAPEDALMN